MTDDHADYILAKLSVAFPGKPLSVEEVRYWGEKLRPYDFDEAMAAVTLIEDNCKFWPSWAEYKEYLRACRKRPYYELPKGTATPLSPEEVAEFIREARKAVSRGADGE